MDTLRDEEMHRKILGHIQGINLQMAKVLKRLDDIEFELKRVK